MKKLLIVVTLLVGQAVFSDAYGQEYEPNINGNGRSTQQRQTIDAYRSAGGSWQAGRVSIVRSPNGIIALDYNFDGYARGGRGQFVQNVMLVPLNPNHQLAKEKNFTHYVSSPAGALYMTVY
jgi:hypothetical protein